MRPGPPRGDSTSIELTVTPELAEAVAPGAADLCTAPALLAAAEGVARELLTPHLEAGEVAAAVAVDVTLRSPLPVGTTVTLTATVATVAHDRLVCEVLARRGGTIAARGSVEHRIVDGAVYAAEIAAVTPSTRT
jgi:predicted thioesterase